MNAKKQPARQESRSHGSLPEWIVAIVSTLFVLAILFYTLREAIAGPEGPPVLTVHADSVTRSGSAWLVMFTVRNDGHQTAANVTVTGTLQHTDGTTHTSNAAVDYVPVSGSGTGGLLFSADPRSHMLQLRVGGYQRP